MYITSLKINGFKNLENIVIKPDRHTNILYGKNAQGKTNLIEAVWLCTGARSFRNTRDRDLIGFDKENFSIELEMDDGSRIQKISAAAAKVNPKEKRVSLNGVKLKNMSQLFGKLKCVIFTPEDLELSKGSPDNRRNFLDLSVSQIKLSYPAVTAKYENILQQRNALLKNISFGNAAADMLDIFDRQLSEIGAYISMLRYNYVKKLSAYASALYSEISKNSEKLELSYQSSVFSRLEGRTDYMESMADEYYEAVRKNIDGDIKCGFTQAGVHRDDLIARINGLYVRDYASQGQHRSVALILKLAQGYILRQETDDPPVILLDDILSELDRNRQDYVISKIKDMQIFITCCETSPDFAKGRVYHIEKGRVENVSSHR